MARTGDQSKPDTDQLPPTDTNSPLITEVADTGSVDKIRDILFGNQMRDFEKRFAQMEDRVAAATRDLRDENSKRLESLEQFFKKELDALKSSLKSESEERAEGDSHLSDELKNTTTTLKKALAQSEEKYSETTSELRQQILDQSKSLRMEIQSKSEQAAETLRKNIATMDEAKIDRSALSEYFIEMAMHLSNDAGHEPLREEGT